MIYQKSNFVGKDEGDCQQSRLEIHLLKHGSQYKMPQTDHNIAR